MLAVEDESRFAAQEREMMAQQQVSNLEGMQILFNTAGMDLRRIRKKAGQGGEVPKELLGKNKNLHCLLKRW